MEKTRETGGVFVVDTEGLKPVEYGDGVNLYHNRAAFFDVIGGKDAPLVTLFFLAYNNLEKYTKKSIASLLKYTSHIDMELVLIDNGSTDGTLEFFQSVNYPRKRICRVTKNHGAILGNMAASMELGIKGWGKYFVSLPNDVFVTKHWLDNLLRCMESDERIGVAVPMSDYVTNYQDVDFQYENFEDMQHKAEMFNQSDPRKWEERIRVIPTTMVIRSELFRIYQWDPAFIYYFSDDDLSFQYRRLGYRLMVCGDTYVHHEEDLGGKDSNKNNAMLEKGRRIFAEKYFGIDPWCDTTEQNCQLVPLLMESSMEVDETDRRHDILGVDVQCGQALLSAKNYLHRRGIRPAQLSAYTREAKYWMDLKTVCDGEVFCGNLPGFECYDEIIMGERLNSYPSLKEILGQWLPRLKPGGQIALQYINYPKEGHAVVRFQDIEEFLLACSNYKVRKIQNTPSEDNNIRMLWELTKKRADEGDASAQDQLMMNYADSCRFGQYCVGDMVIVLEKMK